MGIAQLNFYKIIIHGSEIYELSCKKDPTAIVWVHFYKYIALNSKQLIQFTKKKQHLDLCAPHSSHSKEPPISDCTIGKLPLVTFMSVYIFKKNG